MNPDHTPLLICLAGPTASGKSAASMALARRWPIEIIVMDSATIYRGMDIGTAKPTAEEQARVPHHLLDIRDPAQAYSAAEFARDAAALARDIRARGRIPLLCGGTMLYYKALREGLNDLPEADPEIRRHLDAQALERGWPALHAELARVDPVTAARLAPHDSQRLQRALEIWHSSGRPMSDWLAQPPMPVLPGWRFETISLEPSDRAVLHARIARRYQAMIAAGFRTRCGACMPAPTCTRACRRSAAWATGSSGITWMAGFPWIRPSNRPSPPPANWPSARSPGCGRCRSGSLWIACRIGPRLKSRGTAHACWGIETRAPGPAPDQSTIVCAPPSARFSIAPSA